MIADTRIDTTSAVNPVGLHTNYFLHHHEIVSASRFVPALLFTTEEGSVIVIQETPVVAVEAHIEDRDGNTVTSVVRGDSFYVFGEATTNPADGPNDATRFEIVGAQSPRTYITQTGTLFIAIDEDATSLTINVLAVDSDIPQIVDTLTAPVVGDKAVLWPVPHVDPDADLDALFEVTPGPITITGANNVRVPTQEGVSWKKTIATGVTFTDAGDIVTVPHHGASVGDIIVFGAITTTTGVAAATNYYVKTVPTADTMTISATDGGATLALTTNGSAASATFPLVDGALENVAAGQLVTFVATAMVGYELAAGATSSFPVTGA